MGQERQPVLPGEAFDVTPILEACGRVVREARQAQGLSLPQLGAIVGTVHSSIAALEKGRQFTRTPILCHILRRLGISSSVALPDDPTDPRILLQRRIATASPQIQELVRQCLDLLESFPQPPPGTA